jgi:hypothetical protein
MPVVLDLDHSVCLEPAHLAADCFHGQAEKVADIGAAQRQLETGFLVLEGIDVAGDEIEKTRHLLGGSLAPKRHHPVARFVEFAQRLQHDGVFQRRVFAQQRLQRRARHHAEIDIGRRLRRDPAFAGKQPPQQVGRELQAHHLLAAVLQHLGELHHPIQHIAIAGDRRGVGEQFGAGGVMHAPRMPRQGQPLLRRQRPAETVAGFATLAERGHGRIRGVVVDGLHGIVS